MSFLRDAAAAAGTTRVIADADVTTSCIVYLVPVCYRQRGQFGTYFERGVEIAGGDYSRYIWKVNRTT